VIDTQSLEVLGQDQEFVFFFGKKDMIVKEQSISYITILVPEADNNNKLQFPLVFRTV